MSKKLILVVISIAGTTGKTTFTKHGIVPMIPNSIRVSIENLNYGDGASDIDISAKTFHSLAAILNANLMHSYVIDAGASNVAQMFKHFADLDLTRQEIDHWIVPVRAGKKERHDTLQTVKMLLDMNIPTNAISVVPQVVADPDMFGNEFGSLQKILANDGIFMAPQGVLYNEVYNYLKGFDKSVFDIVAENPDFKKLRLDNADDSERLKQIGQEMLIYSLACTARRNLQDVFKTLPFSKDIQNV